MLPGPDRFIESLTHDSIIVQIPFLHGRTRNRLERLLSVFDQDYRQAGDEHLLAIDAESLKGEEVQILVHRLREAAVAPAIRRDMEIEDEILSEIEDRDTTIMIKNQELEQKDQELEQNKQELEQKDNMLHATVQMLAHSGISLDKIAKQLSISIDQVELLLK